MNSLIAEDKLLKEHDRKDVLVFCTIIILIWFIMPVLSVFVICVSIYKIKMSISTIKYCCFLIALTFGLISYTAVSVNRGADPTDLVRYTEQFRAFSETHTFSEFFITAFTFNGGVYLIFDSLTWVLALMFPSNPQVMPLFWITIAYYFLFLAIIELSCFKGKFSKNIFLILLLLTLFGTTLFTQEVELLKQSSSTAIAAYAIFKKLNDKKNSLIFFVIAVMIHTSVIIFIPIYFLFKKRMVNTLYWIFLGFSMMISMIDINKMISIFGIGVLAEKAEHYVQISSWTITKINYTMFLIYSLLVFLILYEKSKFSYLGIRRQYLFNLNILLFCMMLTQFSSIHNIVRYTYLYSPFYILAFFFILTGQIQKKHKLIFCGIFCAFMFFINVSYTVFYLGSSYTNSYMDNSVFQLLSSNVYTFLTYSAVN